PRLFASLSSLHSPPHPRSTLFPYTTLFRSSIYEIPAMLHKQGLDNLICDALCISPPPADLTLWDQLVHAQKSPRHTVRIGMVGKDRKSTRLNSSHVSISYAVFCLKKKTRNH